jgi:hypothetical protein
VNTVHSVGNAKIVLSHLNVDADGSPHAYAPANSGLEALDYLADAGKPGNWWALATDSHGHPYIQGANDPAPGYYISTTSLEDPSKAVSDPARYVNAETVPFVVIPSEPKFGIVLGDVGFAFNLHTGDSSEFIVGDTGPANQLGEASVLLAENLSLNASAKVGGTSSSIILYVFFENSKLNWPSSNVDILAAANKQLEALGGINHLKVTLPGFNWSKF